MHTIFRYPVQTASIAPGGARRSPTMAGAVATLRRTIKRPGIPRPLRLPLSSPHQTECTASSGSRCNQNHGYKTLGNLLLWIRLARTGQMISGLLLFCSHRNFHFFFTSHTTFNLHFFAMVSAKMCHRQRKNPCPQDKGCFLVTRTGLEPMLPP